jgi:hypothetical protein
MSRLSPAERRWRRRLSTRIAGTPTLSPGEISELTETLTSMDREQWHAFLVEYLSVDVDARAGADGDFVLLLKMMIRAKATTTPYPIPLLVWAGCDVAEPRDPTLMSRATPR